MEFNQQLRGTKGEITFLFNNFNVRYYDSIKKIDDKNNLWYVHFRVSEDFKHNKRIKTIQSFITHLYVNNDEYYNENNIKSIENYINTGKL